MKITTKILAYLWFPVYAVLLGLTLDNTLPYKGDEAYYIASSIKMLQSGNYLIPTYFGEVRFQKPLIPYWLTALGYKLFGINLWSGRLLFLLLSCVLLIVVYKFALLILPDAEFAYLTIFLLSSATLFVEFTRVSMTDMPLTFFTTLALYYFCSALQTPERLPRYYLFAYISVGLAYSSKGFIGTFPCLAIAVYLLYARPENYKKYFLRLFHPCYLLVFVLLAFSWYLYAYFSHTDDLMKQFAIEASDSFASNLSSLSGNLLFYLRVLLTYYLPFTPIAAYLSVKKRRQLPAQLFPILLYIGLTLVLLTLLLSRHKARYVLVIFPALTLVISYIIYHSDFRGIARYIAIGVAGGQIAIFLIYPSISGRPLKELIQYWEGNVGGDLATYHLSRQETSWVQALSHGAVHAYREESHYLLIEATHLDHFENPEVLKQATQLSQVHLEKGKLVKHERIYVLIDPHAMNAE